MTKFQKALYSLYGEKLESMGFLPHRNFWYRISPTGIASFVGTRRLHRGDLEFWAASQPVFSDFCTQIDNITTPTSTYFNLMFYPTGNKNVLFDNLITAKLLENDDKLRIETEDCLTGIIERYFRDGFSSDMTVSECLQINDAYMNICLSHKGQVKADWRDYTYTQIEMMLYLHINYDVCLKFYRSLTREWLCGAVHMQFTAEKAEEERENTAFIENLLDSRRFIEPEECIRACADSGMRLSGRYNESEFKERFFRAKKYADLIGMIECDDYEGILNHLETKHSENSKECRQLFGCEPLPFSCYLK